MYKVEIESVTGISYYTQSCVHLIMFIVRLYVFGSHFGSHFGFTNIVCKWYISDLLRCGNTYDSTQNVRPYVN